MHFRHAFAEAGEGHPLILLHGNGESKEYFAAQMNAFAVCRHVYALDTRGHGASERGDTPFTLAQFAQDLEAFRAEHGFDSMDLLGFSDGGNIAMLYALRYPERVSKLILNGANLDPSGVKRSVQLPVEIGYRLASFFARLTPKAKSHAELLGLMVNEPHIAPEALAKLTMPALVIAGDKDMIREDHTRKIAASLPDSELAILPGDHFVAAKNPEAFNRTVLGFLEN
ncbi:MAG: alpha/beta hydrolase [Clostridia bacterium]|nr:alpha/beta hydrolase [Clostridia bacterium]